MDHLRLCFNQSVHSQFGKVRPRTGFQTLYLVMVRCYLQVTAMISDKNRSKKKNNKNLTFAVSPFLYPAVPSLPKQPDTNNNYTVRSNQHYLNITK